MKIKEGFAKRQIAGANMVVPVGAAAKELNAMITLNDTGSFIWDCLKKDMTLDELTERIVQEYEVDRERAASDAEKFLKLLSDNGILE